MSDEYDRNDRSAADRGTDVDRDAGTERERGTATGPEPGTAADRDAAATADRDAAATADRDAGAATDYDETTAADRGRRNPRERGKWISALIALAGLWLLAQAVWLDLLPGNFWNDVVVGALLVALGAYNYYRRSNKEIGSMAAAGLAALLGLWLAVSPWVYGDAGTIAAANEIGVWNDVIVGLLVLALGAYSVYEARERDVAVAAER